MNESAAPAESAADLFRRLIQLRDRGQVTLAYDYDRLSHMDCPVAVEADRTIWAYGVIAAVLLALWRGGWWAALAVLVFGFSIYVVVGRSYVRRRIRRRIDERALADLDLWQRLWRFGGIALVPRGGGERCAAPAGNWMALVRAMR